MLHLHSYWSHYFHPGLAHARPAISYVLTYQLGQLTLFWHPCLRIALNSIFLVQSHWTSSLCLIMASSSLNDHRCQHLWHLQNGRTTHIHSSLNHSCSRLLMLRICWAGLIEVLDLIAQANWIKLCQGSFDYLSRVAKLGGKRMEMAEVWKS